MPANEKPHMPTESRIQLLDLARKLNALQYGNFTLTGGQSTDYYFDGRLLTLHPHGLRLVCQEFIDRIRDPEIAAVGGPTLGADPIVGGLLLVSRLRPGPDLSGFLIRKAAKGHGTGNRIEGPLSPGQKVALVDDTCSHGGTLLDAVQAVEAAGGQVSQILVMLNRVEDGGSVELQQAGYPVTSLFTSYQLKAAIPRPGRTPEETLANRFQALAELWEQETGGHFLTIHRTKHPAFQQVVDMGPAVITLLLHRMHDHDAFWFEALKVITGEDPNRNTDPNSIVDIVDYWTYWGRRRGYLPE